MTRSLVGSLVVLVAVAEAGAPMELYPRATTNATTAFPTATGQASHNCSWSWSSWTSASYDSMQPFVNITTTYTYHNLTASTTVGCDNVTRIVGDLTTIATGTNVTTSSSYVTTYNFTEPPPTCTPPIEECLSIHAYTLDDVVKYCPQPTTSSQQICGPCGIVGGTIDLLYFPPPKQTPAPDLCATTRNSATLCPLGPTTATNNATNPYDNVPCYYATGTESTQNSGPYITSDGHTFYENRAYISVASVYATNRCGYVGEKHMGSIVEVHSTDVYSIGGYHHFFADQGYSFNFQDLYNPPSSAYYLNCDGGGGMACEPQQTARYSAGTDFINGVNTVDFGRGNNYQATDPWIWPQAYAPIILMPTQLRSLDPAWSTCILDLAGLYDPPRALTKTAAVAPTAPTPDGYDDPTTTAKPGSSPGNSGSGPTSRPATTTSIEAQPILQPSDTSLDTPTLYPSPVIQPTGGDDLDTPAQSDNVGATGNQGTTTTQNAGGVIASILDPGNQESPTNNSPQGESQPEDAPPNDAQPDASQPTGTMENVGDVIASVLGMTSSPTAGGQQSGNDEGQQTAPQNSGDDALPQNEPADNDTTAPAPVLFTGSSATYTASALPGSSNVYVVDGTQTVTASAAGNQGSQVELEVDGETVIAAASASQNDDGSGSVGSPTDSSSGSASGDDSSSPPASPTASSSESASGDTPQQTGNVGNRAGIEEHLLVAVAGGVALIALGL